MNTIISFINSFIRKHTHFQGRTSDEYDKAIEPALHGWGSKLDESKQVEKIN
jgi:hypothetical protein